MLLDSILYMFNITFFSSVSLTSILLISSTLLFLITFSFWIPNPGVPVSKPLGGSKVNSVFPFFQDRPNEY